MTKILKNQTASDVFVDDVGITVPASGQYTINPTDYLLFDESVDIATLINAGTLIVNDGIKDLSIIEGLAYIRYPDNAENSRFNVPDSTEGDFGSLNPNSDESTETAIRNAAKVVRVSATDTRTRHLEDKILSGPGVNVVKETDGTTGEETLKFDATGNFEGKGFQTTFAGNGTVRDEWLSQEDTNVESNESPDVFKYRARLVGIDFTNQNQNTDPTFVIAIKEYPFTNLSNPDRFYKWTLTNARSAVRTNQTLGFEVNPGDVMAVYCVDTGGNPNDVIITMDFIILDATNTDLQFSYSQNFSSVDIPALNTIPEVLV